MGLVQLVLYVIMNFFGFSTDSDNLIVWVEFFSTIFFAATVGVLVWETILQRKEIEVDEYAELRQHHHDLITLQIEYPETLEIFDVVKMPDKYNDKKGDEIVLEQSEKRLFQVYLAEFDLYERVWLLKEEKGKLTEYEWICWIIYLEKMSHHWLFRHCFNQTRTIFDNDFMKYVKEKIIDRQDAKEETRQKILDDAQKAYITNYKEKLSFSDKDFATL
jgi:hypothetical protein